MFHIERFKNFFGFRNIASRNLKETFSAITELLLDNREEENTKIQREAFLSLVYPLLIQDGHISEERRTVFRNLLEEHFDRQTVEDHLNTLSTMPPGDTGDAAAFILHSSPEKAMQTAKFLIVLAVALGISPGEILQLGKITRSLGMDQEDFSSFFRKITEEEKKKQRLRNSSRGIIATLVIIAIFLLTAKYLQSVIFGLLLACILWPLERFFEHRLTSRKGLFFWCLKLVTLPVVPLKKLASAISRKIDSDTPDNTASRQQLQKSIIRQAVSLCCITVLLVCTGTAFGISKLTGHYMKDLQNSIREWESSQISSLRNSPEEKVSKYNFALEKIRKNVESIPVLDKIFEHLQKVLNNRDFQKKVAENIIAKSGGIINFTGTFIGGIVSVVCDILLTLFFALLFLFKFAEFNNSNTEKHSGSEYIVRMFFSGIWLPGADENVIKETCRIIDGILFRFRVWLKGYLTLILVDSTVYTTCFFFLGVPFFFPLGLIAGCGIALPYLGPVISCLLTLLVTILAGSATLEILIAIIICYLIYNGIVEQFILYPAVIGESLGLSTLETIIVVLLGAVIAGIPGMIFALPTASIAKYLIPQIYRGFSANPAIKKI